MRAISRQAIVPIGCARLRPHTPPPRPRCHLKGKDPRNREKYAKITKRQFAKAKNAIPKDLQKLKNMRREGASAFDIMLLHSKILKNSIKVRMEAARRTRHIYSGSYAWSPEWRKKERELQLWRIASKDSTEELEAATSASS